MLSVVSELLYEFMLHFCKKAHFKTFNLSHSILFSGIKLMTGLRLTATKNQATDHGMCQCHWISRTKIVQARETLSIEGIEKYKEHDFLNFRTFALGLTKWPERVQYIAQCNQLLSSFYENRCDHEANVVCFVHWKFWGNRCSSKDFLWLFRWHWTKKKNSC